MVQLLIVLLALCLAWIVISYVAGGSLGASLTAPLVLLVLLVLLVPGAGMVVIRYKQVKHR